MVFARVNVRFAANGWRLPPAPLAGAGVRVAGYAPEDFYW